MSPFEITVAAMVESQGRFLLVEELIDGRLVLNQPAGHLEHGETLLQAVMREVREETAWQFTASEFLGVYLWRHPHRNRLFKRFAFIGTVSDHRPLQPLDTGIIATHWLTADEIRARDAQLRSPFVLRCLEDCLAGERAPLESVATLALETAGAVAAIEL